jgi:hypothetical protein
MKYLFLSILAVSLAIVFAGCEQSNHHHRHVKKTPPKVEIVNSYSVQSQTNSDILYYYVIYDANTKLYYSSSSPKLINASTKSSYSALKWIKSANLPEAISKAFKAAFVEKDEIEIEDLGEAETDLESDYSSIEDDMESISESDGDMGGEADAGGDSGGDAGGDAGGGDCGGGDGGGE